MLNKKLQISNLLGLHTRATAKFVNYACRYESSIKVTKDNLTVNGKSIMGMMTLAASKGNTLEITIQGKDEEDMMQALEELINNRFGEAE